MSIESIRDECYDALRCRISEVPDGDNECGAGHMIAYTFRNRLETSVLMLRVEYRLKFFGMAWFKSERGYLVGRLSPRL